jgi:hypothetical protein
MEWVAILVAVVFTILALACIFALIIGLPGTWIMLGLAVVIELVDRWYLPVDDQTTFGWWVLLVCVAMAGIGEILEFFAGLLGAKKAGSSKRGMIGSLIGGIVGAVMGTALPAPLIGTIIGTLIGTFLGALIGEATGNDAKELRDSVKPATGALIGRVLGTLSKLPIAMVILVILVVRAFWL